MHLGYEVANSQHADVPGTATTAAVANAPAGSTYYYTVVAYKGALEAFVRTR